MARGCRRLMSAPQMTQLRKIRDRGIDRFLLFIHCELWLNRSRCQATRSSRRSVARSWPRPNMAIRLRASSSGMAFCSANRSIRTLSVGGVAPCRPYSSTDPLLNSAPAFLVSPCPADSRRGDQAQNPDRPASFPAQDQSNPAAAHSLSGTGTFGRRSSDFSPRPARQRLDRGFHRIPRSESQL